MVSRRSDRRSGSPFPFLPVEGDRRPVRVIAGADLRRRRLPGRRSHPTVAAEDELDAFALTSSMGLTHRPGTLASLIRGCRRQASSRAHRPCVASVRRDVVVEERVRAVVVEVEVVGAGLHEDDATRPVGVSQRVELGDVVVVARSSVHRAAVRAAAGGVCSAARRSRRCRGRCGSSGRHGTRYCSSRPGRCIALPVEQPGAPWMYRVDSSVPFWSRTMFEFDQIPPRTRNAPRCPSVLKVNPCSPPEVPRRQDRVARLVADGDRHRRRPGAGCSSARALDRGGGRRSRVHPASGSRSSRPKAVLRRRPSAPDAVVAEAAGAGRSW